MRSAPMSFAGGDGISIINCEVRGFDDFAHFDDCKNVQLENNVHIPASSSDLPDEKYVGLREEPRETVQKGTSGKIFSLPPRQHRRLSPHNAVTDSESRYLPNVCENEACSAMFPSTIKVEHTLNFKVIGQRGGRCPRCGTVGRIISGTYDCDQAELFLSELSPQAIDYLAQFAVELNAATTRTMRDAVVERFRNGPEAQLASKLFEILGDTKTQGIIAALTLILTVVSVYKDSTVAAPPPPPKSASLPPP